MILIGINRYLRMRKSLLATFSSDGFKTMVLNSKNSRVVSYIQDNKDWERIYALLKIIFPCLRFLRLADSNRSGMDKVFYCARITKISMIKSSSDIDNKELFPVSGSSYKKVWISSDSDTEEEDNIGTDDPKIIDSDTLEILSF